MADLPGFRHSETGSTMYVTIRNAAGQYWDAANTTLETLVPGSWGDYDIAATETPASSYQYIAAVPATLAAGVYYVDLYKQAGGSPAITDWLVASCEVYWDGTSAVHCSGTNHAQTLSESPTDTTVGAALFAQLAQGAHKIGISGTTLTLYKSDGVTAWKTFTLDDGSNPSTRTPD